MNALRILLATAAALLLAAPAVASAQNTIDSLCAYAASPTGTAPGLLSAAETAETVIGAMTDKGAAGDRSIAILATAAAATPSADGASLAAFCGAAGEAYRVARGGNPYQARTLLTEAFRHAETAHQPARGGLAAYRLGLLAQGASMAGGRGLRRSIAGSPGPVPASGTAMCGMLADPAPGDQEPRLAALALGCAAERAHDGADDRLAARAALSLARFWLALGRRTPGALGRMRSIAATAAIDGLAAAGRIADPAARAQLLGRLAEAALDAGAPGDPQVGAAARAMHEAAGGDAGMRAFADAIAGRLALADGDPVHAAALLRRAIFAESQTAYPARLADWHLLLAEAEPTRRAEHVDDAFRALEAARPLLPPLDALTEESSFALHIRPVYEALLASRLDAADGAAAIAQIQRIAEAYRQAELQSLFGSDCVAARPPVAPAELAKGEMLLYPILLPDRVELLYASGDDPAAGYRRVAPTPAVPRDEIIAAVATMVDATSFGDDGWRAPAATLYAALIAPIAERLSPGGTLVIVPDGILSGVPFAALTDAQGRFLIQRSRVDVVPSLAYAQPGAGHGRTVPRVVAAALEKEQHFPFGTYEALAGTSAEARFAVGADGPGRGRGVLLQNFRRADLTHALGGGGIDILHLATHANFNGRSDRSYIVADGELIPIGDLRAMIERNGARGAKLDLIVLSACESAVGDDEASMGLAGAAVQAGARSALASLWKVNDAGTAALMRGFYTRYRAGEGKAEALRGAQLGLIAQGGDFAEPNIWAAFTLLGSWR